MDFSYAAVPNPHCWEMDPFPVPPTTGKRARDPCGDVALAAKRRSGGVSVPRAGKRARDPCGDMALAAKRSR
jgi:hypothetical protein